VAIPRQYRAAESLEEYLGDPTDPGRISSFCRSMEIDEREEYPEEANSLLDQWGIGEYYIPSEFGGRLTSFEELFALVPVIARRDLTVAVAHLLTFGAAMPIWLGGSPRQKHRLAEIVRSKGKLSLALSERAHGSDLIANECRAHKTATGYLLSGEKWPIGNATRSSAVTVFARTDVNGGPRGFSLYLVEKNVLRESSYCHLPKVKTLGLRGGDLSGISFNESLVPEEALVGPLGSGLELTLKGLQIMRTLTACLSLGAGDTALRIVLDFALSRRIYGDTVFAIPHVKSTLLDAFTDLLICSCLTVSASRALHILTEQMYVWSAVVKYFVPMTIERMIQGLSTVLGARFYLREAHYWGIFQKILRDNAIASLGEGSGPVQLDLLGLHLRQLSNRRPTEHAARDESRSRLELVFSLDATLPNFAPHRLAVFSRGYDEILRGIEVVLPHLYRLSDEPKIDAEVLEEIITLTKAVLDEFKSLEALAGRYAGSSGRTRELFDLARKQCELHAAAACVYMWVFNREALGEFFARGEWLAYALNRLVGKRSAPDTPLARGWLANLAEELLERYRNGTLVSIVPIRLARG
jgi:alkylation response protein AidB-like acyl-CoA dehydrogenase